MRFSFVRTFMIILALALAGAACQRTNAPAPQSGASAEARDPEADQAAVAKVLEQLHVAWNAHDMQAFGAVFSEDASFINIFGHRMVTRATIVEQHQKIHERQFRETQLLPVSSQIRLVGAGVAVAVVNWRLIGARDPRTDAPVEPTTGFMTSTLREHNGVWEIVALQNTRTLPLPGGPDEATDKPADKPADNPAGPPAGKPAGKPAGAKLP